MKSPMGANGFLNGPKVLSTNSVEKHANQGQKHERNALAALAKRFVAILVLNFKGSRLAVIIAVLVDDNN